MSPWGEHSDDWTPGVASPGEAHSEWHRNARVPMGTPGCPQDACHDDDELDWCEHDIDAGAVAPGECVLCRSENVRASAARWARERPVRAAVLRTPGTSVFPITGCRVK